MSRLVLIPEVANRVSVPLEDKVLATLGIISRNLAELRGRMCCTLSGGKDSTLVTWFVTRIMPDIPVVFNDTGVEYPETVAFVHWLAARWSLNLVETKPEMTFWECVDKFGFPARKRRSRRCCYYLKDKPMTRAVEQLGAVGYFTGVTAVENRTRMFNARDKGTCYWVKGVKKVHPILWWTPDEVIRFSENSGVPLNPIYARGADRIGCSTCTAFVDWEKQLSTVNPKLYRLVKNRMSRQSR